MAFIHGKAGRFSSESASFGTAKQTLTASVNVVLTEISTYVDTIDANFSVELADVTAHTASTTGTTGRAFLPGLDNSTISLGGTVDIADNLLDEIMDGWLRSTSANAGAWKYSPNGAATAAAGAPVYWGFGRLADYRVSSPVGDKCAWTATLNVEGGVNRAVATITMP